MNKPTRKGVQGKRVKIDPYKEETLLLATNNLIQKGKVIGAGKNSICKVGDEIIVSDWLVERIIINDVISFYVPDEAILEIL